MVWLILIFDSLDVYVNTVKKLEFCKAIGGLNLFSLDLARKNAC